MDPDLNDHPLPRYDAVQRRAVLKRLSLLGAVGIVPALAACGSDDSEVFASSSTTTSAASKATTTTGAAAPSTSPATTAASETTDATTDAPATTAAAGGKELPSGAELSVAFTYAVASSGGGFGGPARNPFIAVWIENAAGELVRNISLWYEAGRGERWLNELPSWYAADQTYYDAHQTLDYESVSGASRAAGSYQVVWDGKDEVGARASAGDYVVFVESAREHGTHSLISTPITLGTKATKAAMDPQGDLGAATVTYQV